MEHAKMLWKQTKELVAKSNKIGEREFNEIIAPIEKIHKFVIEKKFYYQFKP